MACSLLKLKCSALLVMYSWLNAFYCEMNSKLGRYLPRDSNGERRTQKEHCRARRVPDKVDGFTYDNPFFVLALTSHVNFQFKCSITPYTSACYPLPTMTQTARLLYIERIRLPSYNLAGSVLLPI